MTAMADGTIATATVETVETTSAAAATEGTGTGTIGVVGSDHAAVTASIAVATNGDGPALGAGGGMVAGGTGGAAAGTVVVDARSLVREGAGPCTMYILFGALLSRM